MGLVEKIKVCCGAGLVALTLGTTAYFFVKHEHIKSNLEPDAVACTFYENSKLIWSINMPLLKNEDVDGNGKYESAFFYKDSQGRTFYQVLRRTPEHRHTLDEPKLYQ